MAVALAHKGALTVKRMNESSGLNALFGIVPALIGSNFSGGPSPDDSDSRHKGVDLPLIPDAAGFPHVAVEHTIVEAYRGQMWYVNR